MRLIAFLFVALIALTSGAHRAVAEEDPAAGDAAVESRLASALAQREKANAHEAARRFDLAIAGYNEVIASLRRLPEIHVELPATLLQLGETYVALGRYGQALPQFEEALKLSRKLFKGDHALVAKCLNNVGFAHGELGRRDRALPLFQESLAMRQRLMDGDHADIVQGLNNVAFTLSALGRPKEAVPLFKEALASSRRLADGDHRDVARAMDNLGSTYARLGRAQESLKLKEEAAAMLRRLVTGDDVQLALALTNVGQAYDEAGRHDDALDRFESAVAMFGRLYKEDHPYAATAIGNLAHTLDALERPEEALPHAQRALAMRRRLYAGDHPNVVVSLTTLAFVYRSLGRGSDGHATTLEALEMARRVYNADHLELLRCLNNAGQSASEVGRNADALHYLEQALSIYRRLRVKESELIAWLHSNLAFAYVELGRHEMALPLAERAVAMARRLWPDDRRDTAILLTSLAGVHGHLGEYRKAIPYAQEALEMSRRLRKGDHMAVAGAMHNLAYMYGELGEYTKALPLQREVLTMQERMNGPDSLGVAQSLHSLAFTLSRDGQTEEAEQTAERAIQVADRAQWLDEHLPRVLLSDLLLARGEASRAVQVLEVAAAHVESRRRQASVLDTDSRMSFVSELRRGDPFPRLIDALVSLGRDGDALAALERNRGREMLALLEQGNLDPLAIARSRAAGNPALLARIDDAEQAVRGAEAAITVARAERLRLRASRDRAARRAARVKAVAARRSLAGALRKRLAALREALPEGQALTEAEVRALLQAGEHLIAYSLGETSYLFVVSRDSVRSHRLGTKEAALTHERISAWVEEYVDELASERGALDEAAVRVGKTLHDALLPPTVWESVRGSKMLYIVPHGALHKLPFEALVHEIKGGQPTYLVDLAPPTAYAPSASVLGQLLKRPRGEVAGADIVAVADPAFEGSTSWPSEGIVVRATVPGGQARQVGVQPGDVVISFDGSPTKDLPSLLALVRARQPSKDKIRVEIDREGAPHTFLFDPGSLGLYLAGEPPPIAGPRILAAQLGSGVQRGTDMRASLAPLPGTKREIATIEATARATRRGIRFTTLVGGAATERALYELAQAPRILHLATHGLVDPFKSTREPALALTPPRVPVVGNDGFLTMGDLLERWHGRLRGTGLVVLSACDTQRGRLDANEGMVSLPWGFCFAGARSAVASLWRVDDVGTSELMTAFYERLLRDKALHPGEALRHARLAVKKTRPAPMYWAPFVLAGAP